MKGISLNDLSYSFEPLEEFKPDPNMKIDEQALAKSREESRKAVEAYYKYKEEHGLTNVS